MKYRVDIANNALRLAHASCELYAKWRILHLTEKEKERKTRELERMIVEREQTAVKKMIHHRHRKQ
jgi:hypothetical protein|nr:MAG TPA: hypothetical protein [Caudoviricetes sp.]